MFCGVAAGGFFSSCCCCRGVVLAVAVGGRVLFCRCCCEGMKAFRAVAAWIFFSAVAGTVIVFLQSCLSAAAVQKRSWTCLLTELRLRSTTAKHPRKYVTETHSQPKPNPMRSKARCKSIGLLLDVGESTGRSKTRKDRRPRILLLSVQPDRQRTLLLSVQPALL